MEEFNPPLFFIKFFKIDFFDIFKESKKNKGGLMCQIIKLQGHNSNIISFLIKYKNDIKESLDFKGGEGYSFTFFNNKKNKWFSIKTSDFIDGWQETINNLISWNDDYIFGVLFSRQRPEMENENVDLPPYWNEDQTKFVWMHGTISNVEELEKKYNKKVEVDSEVLLFADINEIEGNYSAIKVYQVNKKFYSDDIDKGLGLYLYSIDNVLIHTTDLKFQDRKTFHLFDSGNNLIVSYSGGMDITMSLIYQLKLKKEITENEYDNIYLLYFDYGARAREKEIESLFKMKDYLRKNYSSNIEAKVLKVSGLIHDISMIYQKDIKLINEDSTADAREAESTLAYIPFRNTIFAELMATFAEGRGLESVDFLFGLNLSEGMVFMDNSEIWLDHVNKLIKRAGKKYYPKWQIKAPFHNKTKINMLKTMFKKFGEDKVNELLEISYSCYYPREDGSPCGECGSCLLRKKALEIAKGKK